MPERGGWKILMFLQKIGWVVVSFVLRKKYKKAWEEKGSKTIREREQWIMCIFVNHMWRNPNTTYHHHFF